MLRAGVAPFCSVRGSPVQRVARGPGAQPSLSLFSSSPWSAGSPLWLARACRLPLEAASGTTSDLVTPSLPRPLLPEPTRLCLLRTVSPSSALTAVLTPMCTHTHVHSREGMSSARLRGRRGLERVGAVAFLVGPAPSQFAQTPRRSTAAAGKRGAASGEHGVYSRAGGGALSSRPHPPLT